MVKAKEKAAGRQSLAVRERSAKGTRPVKRLRREGLVPGVVYGRDMDPLPVAVNQRELVKLLHSKTGEHALVTLQMAGAKAWEKPVLVKALQHDPVDGHVVHVDFHAILLTERLRVGVPVVLKGDPVGVKQDGGILEHFLREVEVECLPTEIPASVEFDVSALKIGEAVHVRDLVPPANTKITSDPSGVIVSVQMPKEEKPEEAAAAVTEPEVIREKKEEVETASGEDAKGEKEKAARAGAGEGRSAEAKKDKESKS